VQQHHHHRPPQPRDPRDGKDRVVRDPERQVGGGHPGGHARARVRAQAVDGGERREARAHRDGGRHEDDDGDRHRAESGPPQREAGDEAEGPVQGPVPVGDGGVGVHGDESVEPPHQEGEGDLDAVGDPLAGGAPGVEPDGPVQEDAEPGEGRGLPRGRSGGRGGITEGRGEPGGSPSFVRGGHGSEDRSAGAAVTTDVVVPYPIGGGGLPDRRRRRGPSSDRLEA
jgi:hypothetical protein